MSVVSNVPKVPHIIFNDADLFTIGDCVRVQIYPKDRRYPYAGGGYIGKIENISHDGITIKTSINNYFVALDDIFIIRKTVNGENFVTTPYINNEEKEFWQTHCRTRDGIKRKNTA